MRAAVKRVGRIIHWSLTAFLALLLIANLYTIAARQITGEPQPDVFGWSWAVVISGSMEPAIHVNDLIIVRKQNTYAVGDIISFTDGNSVVTHRIVEKGDGYYITRGDANNKADEPVPQEMVIGKVRATVPRVGLVIEYLRTPLGMLGILLLGLLLIKIPDWINRY